MNKFCVNCGSSIVYSFKSPPKFCSSCGESIDGSAKASECEPEEEAQEFRPTIPKRMKLEYEVSYAEGPRSMNEIMKERKTGLPPVARKKYDGDPMRRALEECKPARESTDIG